VQKISRFQHLTEGRSARPIFASGSRCLYCITLGETAMTATNGQDSGMPGALDNIVVNSALNDGTLVCLRTITPDDEQLLRDGIAKLSAESRYLRFFSPTPQLPDAVIERLVDVDGHDHIAWGAICAECSGQPAIGAVHAVRHRGGGRVGEFSVAVIDEFQGRGLARMMTAALLVHCLVEGLTTLDIHILSENAAAKRLVKSLDAEWTGESAGVAEYRLDVAAGLAALRTDPDAPGVQDVLRTLGAAL
jgi:ribosomal protein S18 acetylase RimI-like enzyme